MARNEGDPDASRGNKDQSTDRNDKVGREKQQRERQNPAEQGGGGGSSGGGGGQKSNA
jgi:hypothetical protein